jgi:hypothetical protein
MQTRNDLKLQVYLLPVHFSSMRNMIHLFVFVVGIGNSKAGTNPFELAESNESA